MANKVQQIIEAIESQCSKHLVTYQKLKYVYDVQKNTFKGNPKKYGVRPLGASETDGVIRASTLDQNFQIILTDNYVNAQDNDQGLQDTVKDLFSKMNDLEKQLFKSKLGLSSIVLFTSLESIDEPEIFEEDKIAVLRAEFLVKYRTNLD